MACASHPPQPIPADTADLAWRVCPVGTVPMHIRDALGPLYTDPQFAALFASTGREAISPAQLALVSVLQFLERLGDRQAADAVRTRIDWKYALGLPLDDSGFCHTVLTDFRVRLIAGGQDERLLTRMLEICATRGWLDTRRQRTDATHVLAAIRTLTRTELAGETLRAALNTLAMVAPTWLQTIVPVAWYDRYARRIEVGRLSTRPDDHPTQMQTFGTDGATLLAALQDPAAPSWLMTLPAVAVLQQVWEQQFVTENGTVRPRTTDEVPPATDRLVSPYDPEARTGVKRNTMWDGYKVHLTETVTTAGPQLITHVETVPAPEADGTTLPAIHQALADAGHTPTDHLLDAGYVDADHLVASRTTYQMDLIGPVPADTSWQARAGQGYDVACFAIEWAQRRATCPQGHTSTSWSERTNHRTGAAEVLIRFAPADCQACAKRSQCTTAAKMPRTLTVRPQAEYTALQAARARQQTDAFKTDYAQRAGIEGTISQGVRRTDLRRSRYRGLAKTHLQHVLMAVAINMDRVVAWVTGVPRSTTRRSAFAALAPG